MNIADRHLSSPNSGDSLPASRRPQPQLSQVVLVVAPAECISILTEVMAPLPADFSAAVVILIHGHSRRDRPISLNLNRGRFPFEAAELGSHIRPGHAIVAQVDDQFEIGVLDTLLGPPLLEEQSASPLLVSILSRYETRLLGVVLTSLTPLENRAMRTIRLQGGQVVSLDDSPREWLHEDAPKVQPGAEDILLPAEKIGREILRLITDRKKFLG